MAASAWTSSGIKGLSDANDDTSRRVLLWVCALGSIASVLGILQREASGTEQPIGRFVEIALPIVALGFMGSGVALWLRRDAVGAAKIALATTQLGMLLGNVAFILFGSASHRDTLRELVNTNFWLPMMLVLVFALFEERLAKRIAGLFVLSLAVVGAAYLIAPPRLDPVDEDLAQAVRIAVANQFFFGHAILFAFLLALSRWRTLVTAQQHSLTRAKLLAAASHDLRQPLHSQALYVDALLASGFADENTRFLAERIGATSAALRGLLDGLLDLSKLDAGAVAPRAEEFPIQRLFDELQAEVAAFPDARPRVRFHPSSVWIRSDPQLLRRIASNLLSNALRHGREGAVVIGVRRGPPLRLIVQDTGPGIPADALELVFDEFTQLQNPERDRSKGIGLGLAIVRRLAELLGARVELQSVVGRGSRFSVALERVTRPARAAEPPRIAGPPPRLDGFTVLVIDDEADVRDAMHSIVGGWGARVLLADCGEVAVQVAQQAAHLDLILADHRLRDGETGHQAVTAVRRALARPVEALLITGDTHPDRIRETRATGLELLHKPVPPDVLHRQMARALGLTRA